MEDRLTILPDTILCHILSFLTTKEAVATSVLSKTWKPLWRSIPTLDIEELNYEDHARFVHFVNAVIHSPDQPQPIHKFRLRCISHAAINEWVNLAVQRNLQHFDLSITRPWFLEKFTNAIFTCSTLVVLKLQMLKVAPFSSVDLPFLKVLHLDNVPFYKPESFALLLSGCPVLEDLKAKRIAFNNYVGNWEFKTLPKLVRADISMSNLNVLLVEAVKNVEFLRMREMEHLLHRYDGGGKVPFDFPEFHNLTHIEIVYNCYVHDWSQAVGFLKHCPKLEVLVINQLRLGDGIEEDEEEKRARKYPPYVPECSLLCLKKCYLNYYRGDKGEFQFAKYIIQSGRSLERMTICSDIAISEQGKLEMLEKLSSCTRSSATCKISVQ